MPISVQQPTNDDERKRWEAVRDLGLLATASIATAEAMAALLELVAEWGWVAAAL
jgi:hypothetical protein